MPTHLPMPSTRYWGGAAAQRLARTVGFEPTIPGLESGALGQAKLRPYVMIGPWGRNRTVACRPTTGRSAAELPQGSVWFVRMSGPGGLNRTTGLRLMRALLLTAELHRAGSGGRARTFIMPIQSRPRHQLRHPRIEHDPNKSLIGAACGIRTRVDRFEGPGSCSARRRRHRFVVWSGQRESNPRPTVWKTAALPLSYTRAKWRRVESTIPMPFGTNRLATGARALAG